MRVAQRLYERGYITYMRTDSTTLSETALTAARTQARSLYGAEYVPDAPRRYERKVKNAQEAHEAIRPSGERFAARRGRGELDADELRARPLDLEAHGRLADGRRRGQTVSVRLAATSSEGEKAEFAASGTRSRSGSVPLTWRAPMIRPHRRRGAPAAGAEGRRRARGVALEPQGHTPTPGAVHRGDAGQSARGSGIGRPSTYASILGNDPRPRVLMEEGQALVPTSSRSRSSSCSSSTSRARRLRLYGEHGGRPRPDRRRPGAARPTGCGASTAARTASPGCTRWSRSTSMRSTRGR